MYHRTLATQQKLGNRLFEARTMSGLGQVLREKGNTREAAALFQQARGLFDEIGDDKSGAIQAGLLGDAYMDVENFDAAEEAYRQAMQAFTKVSDLEAVADVRVRLGRAYALNQAPFDALLQWRQALELYRELQLDDRIEFVEKLLGTSGRSIERAEYLRKHSQELEHFAHYSYFSFLSRRDNMNDLLELEVEHFGPIVEAKLDLHPLTVFIGPSNTGKSYLAILIYALHRFFSGDMELDSRSWYYRRGRDDEEKQLSQEAIDALREIAQSLLDNRELPEERSLVLPAPVMDLIRAELDVRGRSLGQEISRCFGTDFNRSELIDYPQFTYQPEGWKDNLPLMNTSAMVSELAPVMLYLRHIIEPDNLLIIEEPEAHLHPAMQAAFARQLASIVQAGIRVIVTTHSEWVLDQLANLVRLSALDKKQREGLDMGEAISSDQFGAWLFRPKKLSENPL